MLAADAIAGMVIAEAAVNEVSATVTQDILPMMRKRRAYQNAFVATWLLDLYDECYNGWSSDRAVAVTGAALGICEEMLPTSPDLLFRAEKETANALISSCAFDDANAMLDRAQRTARTTATPELNLAATEMVFARLLIERHETTLAMPHVERARQLYLASPQPWRAATCRAWEAAASFDSERYEQALAIFTEFMDLASDSGHETEFALHLGNVAGCELRLGRVDIAREQFERAAVIYQRHDMHLPKAKMYGELGRVEIRQLGRVGPMMRKALREFDRLAAPGESVLALLAVAEEMSMLGKAAEVINACTRANRLAIQYHLKADAATALEVLRAAARRGDATPKMIRRVAASHDFNPLYAVGACDSRIN